MSTIDRRALLSASIGGLAVFGNRAALAALQCAQVGVPSRLTIDCSVARNLQLFLKRENLFGLTGLVSMAAVDGDLGSYAAGSLFVYPWLKSKNQGRALAAEMRQYQAFLPGPIAANPLPNMGVPLDEQFCTYGLQAPPQDFIGFSIDVARTAHDPKLPWYSLVDGVGGRTVGIDWASANLNGRWFGGNRAIPSGSECNGQHWRSLIVDGLRRASTMAC
jgi:hypothetical protein